MNIVLIILIILLIIAAVAGIIAAIAQCNKIEEEKLNKDFKQSVREVVKEMSHQFDEYLKDQEETIQEELKDVIEQFENHKKSVKEKIDLLDESEAAAKKRHEQKLRELEERTTEFINNRAKIEAQQMQSVIDFYQGEQNKITQEFEDFKADIAAEKATLLEELNKEKQKQQEIINNYKREEEIKANRNFYKITISENEKSDIKKLKDLSYSFSKPEILLKLIYETYYKTKIEELFKRVLGDNKDKSGIYKITNIENNKTYIGKTTRFIDRLRTHAKRGCGIERINGLLYDAMFEEGLENFTWEVVLTCSKDELTEKEKEMIEFYKSNEYGYNIRKG